MTGAALALASALVMFPSGSRRRLETLGLLVHARRPFPVLPCAAAVAAGLAVVLPVSVVAACSVVGVTMWMRRRRQVRVRRRAAESAALQGALDVLVGELRVGAHPVAAFRVAASEVDGAVAASLRAVATRARLGADVAAGLHSVARSSPVPAHWERLAVCWELAQDHGLAIATLMQTAQRDIVERRPLLGQGRRRYDRRAHHCCRAGRVAATWRRPRTVDRRRASELSAVGRDGWLAVGHRRRVGLRRAAVVGSHHRAGDDMSWAALLLAAALLIGADSRAQVRAGLTAVEPRRPSTPPAACDPLTAASTFDVLAACLRAGMAVSTAASATAPSAPAALARLLNRAADLLALGAEPATAWTFLAQALLRLARGRHRRERRWHRQLRNSLINHAMMRQMRRAPPLSGPRC